MTFLDLHADGVCFNTKEVCIFSQIGPIWEDPPTDDTNKLASHISPSKHKISICPVMHQNQLDDCCLKLQKKIEFGLHLAKLCPILDLLGNASNKLVTRS